MDLMGFQILSKCPKSKPPPKTTKFESFNPIGSRVVCLTKNGCYQKHEGMASDSIASVWAHYGDH